MARSQLSVFPKAVNFLGEKKDPERSLWRNVLIVALEDAVGRHYRNKNFGVGEKSAQAYFLEPNRDFALVCHYAGFDHEQWADCDFCNNQGEIEIEEEEKDEIIQ